MTLHCLFLGCDWHKVAHYAGIHSQHSHICARCGAKKVTS